MKQGTVKWFNDAKGFGFVTDANGQDYFIHHSNISGKGYKSLTSGQQVTFNTEETQKGAAARDLVVTQ